MGFRSTAEWASPGKTTCIFTTDERNRRKPLLAIRLSIANALRVWSSIPMSAWRTAHKVSKKESEQMSELVQLTKTGDVAVITINNPPVNALSPGVPEGIADAIERIANDPEVSAAVLIGGGKTFIAGTDIKEFEKMTSGKTERGAGLLPLLLKIENSTKPIVVAIHGTAFGGGLEVAMAGHYRLASPDAQVGQPEVKLG